MIDKKISRIIKLRQESNYKILLILSKIMEEFPDLRFQQILQNIDLTSNDKKDLYYEESVDTLKTIMNNEIVKGILFKNSNYHFLIKDSWSFK